MITKLFGLRNVHEILLITITVAFGVQTIRILVPGLVWVLGDNLALTLIDHASLGIIILGIVWLAVFSAAFLTGPLRRIVTTRNLVIAGAGGIGIMRLALQLFNSQPQIHLVLAIIGTAFFGIFLTTLFDFVRERSGSAPVSFMLGLTAGIALDTALNGAFLTYDMAWRQGWVAITTTALLILVQWLSLVALARSHTSATQETTGRPLIWLGIGPFLFLELIFYQNIAQFTVFTEWAPSYASILVLATALVGLMAIAWIAYRHTAWPVILLISAGLMASTMLSGEGNPWAAALSILVGQLSLSVLIAIIIRTASSHGTSLRSAGAASGLGMVLLALLVLGYYAVYILPLPYDNSILGPIAGAILAVCAMTASWSEGNKPEVSAQPWIVATIALLLLLLPVSTLATWEEPAPIAGEGFPVRVMSYNLHNGFSASGNLDMEALALVIEESKPDVVALQEVSRGWLVNGCVDMLPWLANRLNMHYIFGPTAGPLWGSAILSRYPILSWEIHELPPYDLYLRRGFLDVTLDLNTEQLRVIATHYHHMPRDSDLRQLQTSVILDAWNDTPSTVIMGDLNAISDTPEIRRLADAGLVDVAAYLYATPQLTFRADTPYARFDYIWVSEDLVPIYLNVPESTASDHLPVIATIDFTSE